MPAQRGNAERMPTRFAPDNIQKRPISVYFTVRQYWGRHGGKSFIESYRNQAQALPGASG